MPITNVLRKPVILLTISTIFLGIYIAKYTHNFSETMPIGNESSNSQGYELPFGWQVSTNTKTEILMSMDAGVDIKGYPFIHTFLVPQQGLTRKNQSAVAFNTSFSFAVAAMVVYGLYGTVSGYRRYRQSLKDYYQDKS